MGLFEVVALIGVGIFIIGGIAFLIAAFRTSFLWGVGCLFLSPISVLYLIFHWRDAKLPFFIQVVGIVMIVSGTFVP